jgi:acetyltransferase-like isoleucine patch superfamily enzyme
VRQGIAIGERALVGAGAAVVSDVDGGATVVGVPAKVRKKADA